VKSALSVVIRKGTRSGFGKLEFCVLGGFGSWEKAGKRRAISGGFIFPFPFQNGWFSKPR
jgi:hypothetical protein